MFGKKQDVVTSLQHKTADILGTFTKTIDDLSSVANAASNASSEKTAEANKLLVEAEQLKDLSIKTAGIASKLNDLFN